MDSAIATNEPLADSATEAQEPRFGPRRSFARALVVAVPITVLLWLLIAWFAS